MARFRFNLRHILAAPASHPEVSCRTLRALALARRGDDAAESDDLPGPGWFKSSWELVSGLEVHEPRNADALLADWLDLCRRAPPIHSAALAQRDEQPAAGLVPASAHGAFGDAEQLCDFGFAVAAEVTHLDQFSEFGIDGLELL